MDPLVSEALTVGLGLTAFGFMFCFIWYLVFWPTGVHEKFWKD